MQHSDWNETKLKAEIIIITVILANLKADEARIIRIISLIAAKFS